MIEKGDVVTTSTNVIRCASALLAVLSVGVAITGSLLAEDDGDGSLDNVSVGPASSNPDSPYKTELVGEGGSWDPDTGKWTETRKTTGGVDEGGNPFCQWEWTKSWEWEEEHEPLFHEYHPHTSQLLRRGEMRMWAYGAIIWGIAQAYDCKLGFLTKTGAVVGRGSVEVKLVSAPECENCTQTITVNAAPSFIARTRDHNAGVILGVHARGEAFGYQKIYGTNLTGVDSVAIGGVVTKEGDPEEYTYKIGPAEVGVTVNTTDGTDEQPFADGSADSEDIDREVVNFLSSVYVKAHADGLLDDAAAIRAEVDSATMGTTITAECRGCCQGWVRIVIGTSGVAP
ncbi:MAG: hypothetical protein K8I27_07035 [Planctomycetes bacterium]|nr:hypothetical protein [Planctomycetota bacterium]